VEVTTKILMANSETPDKRMITYPLEIPDDEEDTWQDWKQTVPRSYPKVGDRLQEFIKKDLESRSKHGEGLLERFDEYESNETDE
jgi:hypothetical protein